MAVITSSANRAVKAARRLARRPAADTSGRVLVEGPQATEEALSHLRRLFVGEHPSPRERALVARAAAAGVEVLEVSDAVLASIASTVTPQALVGVAVLPQVPLRDALAGARLVVVCDAVRDPGNAGAIVRTADAAGADAVVLTATSVDVRNPKAVRASAGSLFHLPVVGDVAPGALVAACRDAGLRLVATDVGGDVDYDEVDLTVPCALLFGNEAHGLSPALRDACDVVLRVPLHDGSGRRGFRGAAESLNLAATVAVVAFEAARQRRRAAQQVIAASSGGRS